MDDFHVISGCSGSGKSSLLAALSRRGEQVVPEPGRRIVAEQLETGGDGVPWVNPQRFVELCADVAERDFDRHRSSRRRTFFDRSLIDVASAVELPGIEAPASLVRALRTKRYARRVFISPPWEELFRPDRERRHSFEDAVREYDRLGPTYERFGYEVVELARASVIERVEFVLRAVGDESLWAG